MVLHQLQCEIEYVLKSATEIVEQMLSRLRSTEPIVHAYVHVDEQQVRSTAEQLDTIEPEGLLHGIPFAVKEVIEVAGIPTTGGCPVLNDHIPDKDATVVQRLREAGAILIGTQVSHELTCGLDEPPTRNPWDLNCYPGGSSAGAGVSVAVGSANFALGTDAAGSIRIPAAMTGVVGLKPTVGLLSKYGVLQQASAPSIDNIGITSRKVSEVRQILSVLAGPDPADATTLNCIAKTELDNQSTSLDIKGIRIAVLGKKTRELLNEIWVIDPEIDDAFNNACELLQTIGVDLVNIELPELINAVPAIVTFFSTELAVAHRDLISENASKYHPEVYAMLKNSLDTPSSAVMDAIKIRMRLCKDVTMAFNSANVDFLLTPTTPRVAMQLSTFDPTKELGSLIPYTCGFNLTGQPAISIPCGFTSTGLPIGLQIVGLPYNDINVLRIAQAYEQQTSWHEQTPSII